MTDQSSNSPPVIQTSSSDLRVREKGRALLEALFDERTNHGDLVTNRRQRAENEFRLALDEAE